METSLIQLEHDTLLGLNVASQLHSLQETTSEKPELAGFAHLLQAKFLLYCGERAQVFSHLQQAMRLGSAEPCNITFSALCRATGQLDRAQSWLDIAPKTETLERELEQGLVLRETGRYLEAERCFLKALHMALEQGPATALPAIRSFHRLGVIYCILGRYSESRSFLNTCIEGIAKLSEQPGLLETEIWHDYAMLCLATGRAVEAEGYACKALYARKHLLGKKSAGLAKTYTLVGNVFLEHDPVRAERSLLKALGLLRLHQGAETDQACAYLSLAALYLQQHQLEPSLRHVQRGSGLLRTLPRPHADRASALLLLSSVLKANGRNEADACECAAKQEYASSLPAEHSYVYTRPDREI
jgi:tetratricopeptide (TPR) repeat protein